MTENIIHAHIARAMQLLRFGNDACPICQQDINPGEEVIEGHTDKPPHTFHKQCMYDYIEQSPRNRKNRCPLCREKLFVGDQLNLIDNPRIRRIVEDAESAVPQPIPHIPQPTVTVMRQVSPAQLNAMLQRYHIARHRFNDCDWSELRIMAPPPQQGIMVFSPLAANTTGLYVFNECTFNCNMNRSIISSVLFRQCKFAHDRAIVIPSMISATFLLSEFIRTSFGNMNVNQCTFNQCNFQQTTTLNTNFAGCTFSNGRMQNANFKASLEGAAFRQMTLTNIKFETTEVERLQGVINCLSTKWRGCTVTNCEFSGRDMTNSTFRSCVFTDCRFLNTDMKDCTIQQCSFKSCNFEGADMQGLTASSSMSMENTFELCEFKRADLRNANFTLSSLTSCHFTDETQARIYVSYRLNGASFRECKITNCGFLENDLTNVDFTLAVIVCTPRMSHYRFTDEQKRQGNFSLATVDGVIEILDNDDIVQSQEEAELQQAIRASLDQAASSSSSGGNIRRRKRKHIQEDSDDD